MPFNMNTFSKMGDCDLKEAEEIINRQKAAVKGEPKNLEEQAISLVGEDIYKNLSRDTRKSSGDVTQRSSGFYHQAPSGTLYL